MTVSGLVLPRPESFAITETLTHASPIGRLVLRDRHLP